MRPRLGTWKEGEKGNATSHASHHRDGNAGAGGNGGNGGGGNGGGEGMAGAFAGGVQPGTGGEAIKPISTSSPFPIFLV